MLPTAHVLDLFAVPGTFEPIPGGQGHSVRAGDLLLSPGRTPSVQDALNPVLAQLAVDLDTRAGRHRRDLRVAMPVPARDGNWTVDGWGATRFEPRTRAVTDLETVRAAGTVFHAELARRSTRWRPHRDDRWAVAERIAFGDESLPAGAPDLARRLSDERDDTDLGPDQFVHGDLAGNLLLDAEGAPLVIDVAPYWRPALWAEAVWVLDSVMWFDADPAVISEWTQGARRQAMVRAALFRIISDLEPDLARYEQALAARHHPDRLDFG